MNFVNGRGAFVALCVRANMYRFDFSMFFY